MIELPVLNSPRRVAAPGEAMQSARGPDLVVALLAEQQSLSAVDEFSRWHERETTGHVASRLESSRYLALVPAAAPESGQQYAFEVDLDRCSGCKSCVVACHSLNGLDESEAWRDVGLLVGGSRTAPVTQHVTTACHHCLEPACLKACPVNAYEKDPVTGIVKHLDDQCFGCQYCTLACPYDVPKYHPGKGIVRKCDMCSSRLAVGEPPACVQSCPHEAIAIRVVNFDQVVEDAEAAVFLPAAPDPQLTLPTTIYKTRRAFPRNLLPADYYRVNPQHAHWPLAVMLTLTQFSVGAFVAGLFIDQGMGEIGGSLLRPVHALTSLAFGLLALAASTLHLGRPRYAYRAVLGLKHSWLSREIVAFGAFAALATAYAAAQAATIFPVKNVSLHAGPWLSWLGWGVSASGIVGVVCSAMIYIDTRREWWSFSRVTVRFTLTAALLGIVAVWISLLGATVARPTEEAVAAVRAFGPTLCQVILLLAASKLCWEAAVFRRLLFERMSPLKRSALLMTGELSSATIARFALGVLGGIVMPGLLLNSLPQLVPQSLIQYGAMSTILFAACLAGELLERRLFFTACVAPRMPGGIR